MNKLMLFLLLTLMIIASHRTAFALVCPPMPEQSKKDWEVEVNAAVLKIGPVKGGELKTRTKNATKDLLGKLPQAGRIYLEQMMYSSYCSALRDDKTIKEAEKAKLLREYNKEIRKSITNSAASVPKSTMAPTKDPTKDNPKPETKLEPATPINTVNQTMNDSPGGVQVGRDMIVVNQSPPPFILEQRLVSINIHDQGRYKTQFWVTVGNPPQGNFAFHCESRLNSIVAFEPPILQQTGMRADSRGTFPCKSFLLSILTSNEVKEGDFSFTIR